MVVVDNRMIDNIFRFSFSRRDFLRLTGGSLAGFLAGCAIDPVTGERQLMLLSEQEEIAIDRKNAPHQFSMDYGSAQDASLNNYVSDVGTKLENLSHRPAMPFSFRVVNAVYVNAYAFPGGSIAVTRAFVLEVVRAAVRHAGPLEKLCAQADQRLVEAADVTFGWETELAPAVEQD